MRLKHLGSNNLSSILKKRVEPYNYWLNKIHNLLVYLVNITAQQKRKASKLNFRLSNTFNFLNANFMYNLSLIILYFDWYSNVGDSHKMRFSLDIYVMWPYLLKIYGPITLLTFYENSNKILIYCGIDVLCFRWNGKL